MTSTTHPRPRYHAAIGMITPSGNVVVERVTTAILADCPGVSAHFSRTPVFGEKDLFPDDYDWDGMMGAAHLIAHAKPDVIAWNGSKGAMLGFDTDRRLCARITSETGIAATTSTIALQRALSAAGATRIAVVSPYGAAYQRKLVARFEAEGLQVVAEAHANLADNLAFASIDDDAIARMIHSTAAAEPQAILTWCTNFPAAYSVAALEQELGVPIFDSVTLAIWDALAETGSSGAGLRHWGSLFETL